MGPADLEESSPSTVTGCEESDGPPATRPAGLWRRALGLGLDLLVVWLLLRMGRVLAAPLARLDLAARAFLYAYAIVIPAAIETTRCSEVTAGRSCTSTGRMLCGLTARTSTSLRPTTSRLDSTWIIYRSSDLNRRIGVHFGNGDDLGRQVADQSAIAL